MGGLAAAFSPSCWTGPVEAGGCEVEGVSSVVIGAGSEDETTISDLAGDAGRSPLPYKRLIANSVNDVALKSLDDPPTRRASEGPTGKPSQRESDKRRSRRSDGEAEYEEPSEHTVFAGPDVGISSVSAG